MFYICIFYIVYRIFCIYILYIGYRIFYIYMLYIVYCIFYIYILYIVYSTFTYSILYITYATFTYSILYIVYSTFAYSMLYIVYSTFYYMLYVSCNNKLSKLNWSGSSLILISTCTLLPNYCHVWEVVIKHSDIHTLWCRSTSLQTCTTASLSLLNTFCGLDINRSWLETGF